MKGKIKKRVTEL